MSFGVVTVTMFGKTCDDSHSRRDNMAPSVVTTSTPSMLSSSTVTHGRPTHPNRRAMSDLCCRAEYAVNTSGAPAMQSKRKPFTRNYSVYKAAMTNVHTSLFFHSAQHISQYCATVRKCKQ